MHVLELLHILIFMCYLCLCEVLEKRKEEIIPLFCFWRGDGEFGQEAFSGGQGGEAVMLMKAFPVTSYLSPWMVL